MARAARPAANHSRPGHLRANAPFLAVGGVHAAAQSQYAFVLPWMVVARGGSAAGAVLAAGVGYLPYVLMSPLAAMLGDRVRPRVLVVGAATTAMAATAAYPVLSYFTSPPFVVVYAAAVVFGAGRPFVDAGVFRAIASLDRREMLRAQSARSALMQAAAFGAPALGLLLFHLGGVNGVCCGICALLALGIASVGFDRSGGVAPPSHPRAVTLRESLSFVCRTPTMLRITGGLVGWNLVAGAAFSLVAPLLSHAGVSSSDAALIFLAGGLGVGCLAYPLVHFGLLRLRVSELFASAVALEGVAFLVFSRAAGAWLVALYATFLLWNSIAASAGNGARALASRPEEQALLGVAMTAVTTVAYFLGVLLAALLAHVFSLRAAAVGAAVLLVVLGGVFALLRRPAVPGTALPERFADRT